MSVFVKAMLYEWVCGEWRLVKELSIPCGNIPLSIRLHSGCGALFGDKASDFLLESSELAFWRAGELVDGVQRYEMVGYPEKL